MYHSRSVEGTIRRRLRTGKQRARWPQCLLCVGYSMVVIWEPDCFNSIHNSFNVQAQLHTFLQEPPVVRRQTSQLQKTATGSRRGSRITWMIEKMLRPKVLAW